MITVERLEDHGVADAVGQPDRIVEGTDRLRARNGSPAADSRDKVSSLLLAMSTATDGV